MVTFQKEYGETMNTFSTYLKVICGVDEFSFSIDKEDDFEYTVRFTYDRNFDVVIHYISGCALYVLSVKLNGVSDDYTINELPITNALGIYGILRYVKLVCDVVEF